MSAEGILLKLGADDFEEIIKYPERSHYISIGGNEPIICTAPDLTKLNWKPAVCYREGKFNWKKEGGWRNIAPPFLCNNYLVEENIKVMGSPVSISVTDIAIIDNYSEFTRLARSVRIKHQQQGYSLCGCNR